MPSYLTQDSESTMATFASAFRAPPASKTKKTAKKSQPKKYKHEIKPKFPKGPYYHKVQKTIDFYWDKNDNFVGTHDRNYWMKMTPEEKMACDSKTFIAPDDCEESVLLAKSLHIAEISAFAKGKYLED